MASFGEILRSLPYRLRLRFDSLGGYVSSILDENQGDLPRRNRLKPEEVQIIQIIVFIYALDFLFQEGTRAAMMAVSEFEKLGMAGFRIGSAHFEGENENVMRGRDLSDALRRTLSDSAILELIGSETSIKSLTIRLMRLVKNGGSSVD